MGGCAELYEHFCEWDEHDHLQSAGSDLRAERVFAHAKPVPIISFATQFTQEATLSASGTRSVRGIRRSGCFFIGRDKRAVPTSLNLGASDFSGT